MNRLFLNAAIAAICLLPGAGFAYIGPGAGLGAIAAVVGVIGAILAGVFAILYYPIKRMLKKKKRAGAEQNTEGQDD